MAVLAAARCVLWVGWGARRAAADVRRLAYAMNAPVISTPRAKGIFPEDDPLYVGVTGLAGHDEVPSRMAEIDPQFVIVLGSRLGEGSSCYDEAILARARLVQVDIDPGGLGAAYPLDRTTRIAADVGDFCRRLSRLAAERPAAIPAPPRWTAPALAVAHRASAATGLIHPEVLMRQVQACFVDRGALVMTDNGNALAWSIRHLKFSQAGQWRSSNLYIASMGHLACGAVGAALASGRQAVVIVGDGAMLMQNEVSTAVAVGAPVVWVVLNDSSYGMCRQGNAAQGLTNAECGIPDTDFAGYARSLGACGLSVARQDLLAGVLQAAASGEGPCVVDVRIDPSATAPAQRRYASLKGQAATHARTVKGRPL
jgi:acetolactate synthase-1/2/3 large subunit